MNLKTIKVGDSIEFYIPGGRKFIYCKHLIKKVTKKYAVTENGLKFDIPSGYYIHELSGHPVPDPVAEKVNPLKFKKKVSVDQMRTFMRTLTPAQQTLVKRAIRTAILDSGKQWHKFAEEQEQIAAIPKQVK